VTYIVEAYNPWTGGAGPSRLYIAVHRGEWGQVCDFLSPDMLDFLKVAAPNAKVARQVAAPWVTEQRERFRQRQEV